MSGNQEPRSVEFTEEALEQGSEVSQSESTSSNVLKPWVSRCMTYDLCDFHQWFDITVYRGFQHDL